MSDYLTIRTTDDGQEEIDPDAIVSIPATPTVDCSDYTAHRFSHRQTVDGWVCDECIERVIP